MAEGSFELKEWLPVSSDVRQILTKLVEAERRPPRFYERLCRFAGRYLGRFTKGRKLSEASLRAISSAKLRVSPEEWWAGLLFSIGAPVFSCFFIWLLAISLGTHPLDLWYLPFFGSVLGALLGAVFYIYPPSLAEIRRSEAQSKAINTIMLLSFELYQRPDLRGAAMFAADSSEGELAEDLQKGLLELDEKRRYESVRHLLTVLAHRWGELDDGMRQAVFDILRSTGQKEEAARLQDIAEAPRRVLESSEAQLNKRLSSLVAPTMAFMVFGSLAIVCAIGLSPVFGVIGLRIVDLKFFALVALALIAGFLAFTLYMGGRRPATIPPPEIPASDPRLPPPGKVRILRHLLPLWLFPALAFLALAWPGLLYLAGWTQGAIGSLALSLNTFWLVWATAAAVTIYAYLRSAPRAHLRKEERDKFVDWGVAFNTIGSRVLDGRPMHVAMAETADLMPGSAVAEQLRRIHAIMDRQAVDLGAALFERGLVREIYNPLVTSFLEVIARIRRASEAAAGRACMVAAEFLGTLRRVERRFEERIGEAVGNLWLVTVVLLPTICAMSIWIMEFMSGISLEMAREATVAGLAHVPFLFGAMEARELAMLKLLMGLLALALGLVMARYISVIRAAHDEVEFWSTVAKTAAATTAVFPLAYVGFEFLKLGI
ncbi:MAG: hypothetical protein QXP65_00080 [Candidatus Hadarchaeales archaeon]